MYLHRDSKLVGKKSVTGMQNTNERRDFCHGALFLCEMLVIYYKKLTLPLCK